MPNTYSQIYIQIVFAVEGRQNLIAPANREELHRYITGIITNRGQKLLAIFVMPDHAHILIGMKPSICLSDLARDIKAGSSNFINEKRWVRGHFNWQEGFGAFSYSRSHVDAVAKYILEQEERHRSRTFRKEYVSLLKKFDVEFEEQYLFNFID